MLAWVPSAQPTVIPFYVSRHQQKIPWVVSSSTIWPLTTTTDQSKNIPFVRSGYFSPVAITCSGVIDAVDAENHAWAASWFCLSCDQSREMVARLSFIN